MPDIQKLRVGLPQVLGLGMAILSVAVYCLRVESRATDAHTRVIELKTEVSDLRDILFKQQSILSRVEADSRAILRTLQDLKAKKQ